MDSGVNYGGFFKVLVPPGLSVEDYEVDSGLNSGVGFKNIDF